jgi:hypothetical protein
MEETQMHDEEQLQKIMEQLQSQFDPRKFMTPSQREIAELSDDALSAEYLLVQSKTSNRSRMQRDFIVTGPDGNAFYLLGTAMSLARQFDIDGESIVNEMISADYEHLLEVFEDNFGEFVTLYR